MPLEWFERDGTERMAPGFELESGAGQKVRLWDYKQRKPVVLYFLEATDQAFLQQLQSELSAYQSSGAQLLVISSTEVAQARELTANLKLTYPLLPDPDYHIHSRYIKLLYPQYDPAQVNQKPVALFVIDRFGAIWCYATATSPEKLPEQKEILEALEFLGNLCNP